jgi:hypothetical protein
MTAAGTGINVPAVSFVLRVDCFFCLSFTGTA